MPPEEHAPGPAEGGQLMIYQAGATIWSFRMVRREGARDVTRSIVHYSLEAILAVGYRVRSARGTAFRQWATARLGELLVKGFTLDDDRFKESRTLRADSFGELPFPTRSPSPILPPAPCMARVIRA